MGPQRLLVYVFICFFLITHASGSTAVMTRMIVDYLALKSLNQVVFYTCLGSYEKAQLFKELSKADLFSIFVLNKKKKVLQKLFTVLERSAVIVQLGCPGTDDILRLDGGKKRAYNGVRSWLLLEDGADQGMAAVHQLMSIPLAIDCDVKVMLQINDVWTLIDAYTVDASRDTPLCVALYAVHGKTDSNLEPPTYQLNRQLNNQTTSLVEVVGYQNISSQQLVVGSIEGLRQWHVFDKRSRLRRRWNFQHVVLKAAHIISNKPPGVGTRRYLDADAEYHRDTFTRFSVVMYKYIQDMLNFRWIGVRTGDFGSIVNGSWTGVVAALNSSRADFGLSPMVVRYQRLYTMDVIGYTLDSRLTTLFRQPHTVRASLSEFVKPLSTGTWLSALTVATLAVGLLVIQRRNAKVRQEEPTNADGLLLEYVNILYLNGPWSNGTWSARVVGAALAMLGFMLQQFYAGSLLSTLLAPSPKLITDLESLIDSSLEYKSEDIIYHHYFFQEPREPLVERLYREKLTKGPTPPFLPVDEGLRRVREGNFAFQTTSSYALPAIRKWSEEEQCSLDELQVHSAGHMFLRAARFSPYTQHLRTAMLQVDTSGLRTHELGHWFPRRRQCVAAVTLQPVGGQLYPALWLLCALELLAVAVLIAEWVYFFARLYFNRRLAERQLGLFRRNSLQFK